MPVSPAAGVHLAEKGCPYVNHILETIEAGKGSKEHIDHSAGSCQAVEPSFCALAPGAMGPVAGSVESILWMKFMNILQREMSV